MGGLLESGKVDPSNGSFLAELVSLGFAMEPSS